MKLVIQIPCFNEAATLRETVEDLPKRVAGFSEVGLLVVDDGSSDGTAQLAGRLGVDRTVRHSANRGLGAAFASGLQAALEMGADVIVNTDADHQYPGSFIPDLLAPIVEGRADIVVGDRQVAAVRHFSPTKRLLQRFGSWVVRWTSGTDVRDATSGFRAFSREAALQLTVFSTYTYTLETIIQAGKKGLVIESVPIRANQTERKSRLIRSLPQYILRSVVTILRIFLMYEPLKVFAILSLAPLAAGVALFLRYAYFFLIGEGAGHVQSFIVAAVLMLLTFQVFLLGLLSDLIARNRRLAEEISYRVRRLESREPARR